MYFSVSLWLREKSLLRRLEGKLSPIFLQKSKWGAKKDERFDRSS